MGKRNETAARAYVETLTALRDEIEKRINHIKNPYEGIRLGSLTVAQMQQTIAETHRLEKLLIVDAAIGGVSTTGKGE